MALSPSAVMPTAVEAWSPTWNTSKIPNSSQSILKLQYFKERLNVGRAGCGLWLTKVPCELRSPTRKLKKKQDNAKGSE